MAANEKITHELSLSEVVNKTFELYRRDFEKYVILFVVVEAIIGILTTLIRRAVTLPKLATGATAQQVLNWLPGFLGALIALITLSAIVTLVLYPIAYGGGIKMASNQIQNERTDVESSVRFAVSRIIWLWIVGIVVGIIVALGLVALVVPGIILAIMFSLVLPTLIIENPGFESMGRSRKLVSQRWLKSLALFIVFGIIIAVCGAIAGAVSSIFGVASTLVSSILSGFYLPLIPIMLTVYYYSNVARIAPPQMSPPSDIGSLLGSKFCPNCGTRIDSGTMFCPSCGAKQPT